MSLSQSVSGAFVKRLLSSIAIVPPFAAAAFSSAAAQTALELPGIVVEGGHARSAAGGAAKQAGHQEGIEFCAVCPNSGRSGWAGRGRG
jgi:hypothetical protein